MAELHMTGATADEVWPLVRDFHYSKRMPSAIRHCFAWRLKGGLFGDTGEPVAAAIFGNPVNREWPSDALELTRLVRRDDADVKLSMFLAWCLRWLRANDCAPFCLSYADTAQGHHGGIYQATGWKYVRLSKGDYAFLDGAGNYVHGRSVFSRYGTRSTAKTIERHPDWTPIRDGDKHVYIFPLRQKLKPLLRRFEWNELPYPKIAARPEDEQSTRLCEAGATPAGRSNPTVTP